MRKSRALFALLPFAALTLAASAAPQPPTASPTIPGPLIPGIGQYRTWARVNQEPYYTPPEIALLCIQHPAAVTKRMIADARRDDPHGAAVIYVYVNPVGKRAFLNARATTFPVGTVVVKEKFDGTSDLQPALLTVMVKRAAGFDPKNGDWEYFALSGDATRVLAPGRADHCKKCHFDVRAKGYVFRNYLPKAQPSGR
jgi:hypothetical protein